MLDGCIGIELGVILDRNLREWRKKLGMKNKIFVNITVPPKMPKPIW